MSSDQPGALAGIPFAAHGFTLAEVTLESAARLTARYEDDDGAGWVNAVVLSKSSTDRSLKRLEHCAVYYEGELVERSMEHRARAAELLAEVAVCVERTLEHAIRQGGPGFPRGLAWRRDLPHTVRLDPEGLLELLPELRGELAPGVVLVDSYFAADRPERPAVSLELGALGDRERVVLTVSRRNARTTGVADTEHLSLADRHLGPDASTAEQPARTTRAAASLLVLLLRLRDTPALSIEPVAPSPPAACSEPSVSANDAGMHLSPDALFRREAELLEPVLAAAARHFGIQTSLSRLGYAAPEAYTVRFTNAGSLPDPTLFAEAPAAFRYRRTMREYFESIGYPIFADGVVRTVPTPESLVRVLLARGDALPGLRPRLDSSDAWHEPVSERLELLTEGTFGITVPSAHFLEAHVALLRLHAPRRAWCQLLVALGHQMSRHVLPLHRLPHAAALELGARIGTAMRELGRERRDDVLSALLAFYRSDLVRHCHQIWETLGRPEDFADAFDLPARKRQLDACLERRLSEARRLAREPRSLLDASRSRARASLEAAAGSVGGMLADARRLLRAPRG